MTSRKANLENELVAKSDVAAGLINAIYANGEQFVTARELRDAPMTAAYEAHGRIRSVTRDAVKYFVRNGRLECVFGFEVQSRPDPLMAARIAGYDGATYRGQMDDLALARLGVGTDRVAPVFTATLYFGDEPWRTNLNLSDRATMSPEVASVMSPFFTNARILVVDFAGMSDEELSKYPNDIRIIAEYFRAKRQKIDYAPSQLEIVHKELLCLFMEYVTGDERFNFKSLMTGYDKEPRTMCEILDRVENRGIKQGIEQGIEQGIKQERLRLSKEMAADLRQEGWSDEKIANFLHVSVVDVRIWLDSPSE